MKFLVLWLKRLATSFFGNTIGYLASFSVAKWAIVITVFTTALLSLWQAFVAFRSQLFKTILPEPVVIGLSAVIPDNFELAFSIYVSAYAMSWVFSLNMNLFFANIHRLTHFGGRK